VPSGGAVTVSEEPALVTGTLSVGISRLEPVGSRIQRGAVELEVVQVTGSRERWCLEFEAPRWEQPVRPARLHRPRGRRRWGGGHGGRTVVRPTGIRP